jgi:hypothetical protein
MEKRLFPFPCQETINPPPAYYGVGEWGPLTLSKETGQPHRAHLFNEKWLVFLAHAYDK